MKTVNLGVRLVPRPLVIHWLWYAQEMLEEGIQVHMFNQPK